MDGLPGGVHISGSKGKSVLSRNHPPKGFEDIANLGFSSGLGQARELGGPVPLSRVSLSRNPSLSIESPIRGSEGPSSTAAGDRMALKARLMALFLLEYPLRVFMTMHRFSRG